MKNCPQCNKEFDNNRTVCETCRKREQRAKKNKKTTPTAPIISLEVIANQTAKLVQQAVTKKDPSKKFEVCKNCGFPILGERCLQRGCVLDAH